MAFVCVHFVASLSLLLASVLQLETSAEKPAPANTKDASQQETKLEASAADWLYAPAASWQAKVNDGPATKTLDAKLLDILRRIGPDMKPASGFRDYNDISIDVSKRAWHLMHQRVIELANGKVSSIWPYIERSLKDAGVSESCTQAAKRVADAAKKLDNWAVQLLNSWGSFPPSGLFEGSLGDIGSYHGCVNMQENTQIHHAHYCTIAFRPVVPNRRDYALIVDQEPGDLLHTFNSTDIFSSLVGKAQYFHYVYLKLGTCFPIACSPVDVQKLAHLIASRWFLMSGPVKCHSKYSNDYDTDLQPSTGEPLQLSSKDLNQGVYIWKPHITATQTVALAILVVIIALALLFTVADLICHRVPMLFQSYSSASLDEEASRNHSVTGENLPQAISAPDKLNEFVQIASPCSADTNNNGSSLYQLDELNQGDSCLKSVRVVTDRQADSPLARLIKDCSMITNSWEFFSISQDQLRNDILCMNGLRCITMSWIIIAHTIQYNDWSAFARIFEVETHLESLANQPLFNASYLVDTFFLISGLLTSYSVFRTKAGDSMRKTIIGKQSIQDDFKNILRKFSCKSYLIGRYLRLTPQIALVSILFILLPLLSQTGGPHWYTMTGEYSENCAKNWWINLFHIQAFYKPDEMCNFVCWWISVDMFYHIVALAAIMVILHFGPGYVVKLCLGIVSINLVFQASKHYQMSLPPNLLSTIPQTGAMWSDMTLKFFWTPVAHALPFLLGFYAGFHLATTRSHGRGYLVGWFTVRRALIGWLVAICSLVAVLYGTYFWITGDALYSRIEATCFYLLTQLIWSLSLCWIILACEFGFGSFVASILSCRLFLVLGKASYLVYLSHFLVLFTFFGSQNLLVEPTKLMITYIVIGNICVSMMFGSFLCIVFEMPWLKLQRRIMTRIR